MDHSLTSGWLTQLNTDYTAILVKGDTIHPVKKRKMARHIGGNPLRPICCDVCMDIVRIFCVFSRIRGYSSPTISQSRRWDAQGQTEDHRLFQNLR